LNELAGVARHGYANIAAGPLQTAQHLDGFIRSDSTGHSQRYSSFGESIAHKTYLKLKCNTAELDAQ